MTKAELDTLARKAIAEMVVDENTDHEQLAALVAAIESTIDPEDDKAEHDGCGGELVAPMTPGGSHFAPPAEHYLAGNPDAFMVTCLECAAVNWYTDATLKRLARKVAMRFVVQAAR